MLLDPMRLAPGWSVNRFTATTPAGLKLLLDYNPRRVAVLISSITASSNTVIGPYEMASTIEGFPMTGSPPMHHFDYSRFGGMVHLKWYAYSSFSGPSINVVEVVWNPELIPGARFWKDGE